MIVYSFGTAVILLYLNQVQAQTACDQEQIKLDDFKTVHKKVSKYSTGLNCSWTVSTNNLNRRILYAIRNINTGTDDFLNAYDGTSTSDTRLVKDFNGIASNRNPDVTSGGNLLVTFTSGQTENANEKGFDIYFMAAYETNEPCGSVIGATSVEKYLTSHNFPDLYDLNRTCLWQIRSDSPESTIVLDFKFMDIEVQDGKCPYDILRATKPGNTTNTVFELCGENDWTSRQIKTNSSEVDITLVSDTHTPKRGFVLTYRAENAYIAPEPNPGTNTTTPGFLLPTWTLWTPWSDCSASCDSGIKYRTRECITIDDFASYCDGNGIEHDFCQGTECQSDCWDWFDSSTWANPYDCRDYFQCNEGTKHLWRCPTGQFYDSSEGGCRDASQVYCMDDPCSRNSSLYSYEDSNEYASHYWACENGKSYPSWCRSGTLYSPQLQCCVCDPNESFDYCNMLECADDFSNTVYQDNNQNYFAPFLFTNSWDFI